MSTSVTVATDDRTVSATSSSAERLQTLVLASVEGARSGTTIVRTVEVAGTTETLGLALGNAVGDGEEDALKLALALLLAEQVTEELVHGETVGDVDVDGSWLEDEETLELGEAELLAVTDSATLFVMLRDAKTLIVSDEATLFVTLGDAEPLTVADETPVVVTLGNTEPVADADAVTATVPLGNTEPLTDADAVAATRSSRTCCSSALVARGRPS